MPSARQTLAATSLVRAASRRSGCFWRASTFSLPHRSYSSSAEPLVVVSDLPAPNSGHIRVLELNRPDARNAISLALLAALRGQIEAVADQYDGEGNELPAARTAGQDGLGPTRALILASAVDSCFCAGADLKERRTFTQEETNAFLADLRGTLSALSVLPIPTIAAVSSVALGGGFELALSTHMRVFSSNAFVGLPETRLGIIPGAGGTYRLPMLIGVGRARDLILTGRRVSAPEAYFLGIADRLVEVSEEAEGEGENSEKDEKESQQKVLETARRAALSEAVRLAEEICSGGPVAVRAALQAVQYPTEAVENAMYDKVVATHDRNEALRAFAEKRRPVFQGQ
ncbi:mitochondrial methylglutaconyl-hydratase [Grosmannia clavigera kw1407]|uniref:Mitochondrial methylglutaconyl-hydratase n=1 Tax=Grosmannia clavigera (strain kw1407 / UAMH 11150) TaxID=655863 RepID=F0XL96_GROCL|nr:mitochondrial methylglutaconyl-hydratase [Grosmannia clavigera kw1407]EFX01296.1 mitochondrial methylglutaconyl-hydratase [Grosmannia clavigera kw1407]